MPFMKVAMDKKKEQLKGEAKSVLNDIENTIQNKLKSNKKDDKDTWDLNILTNTSVTKVFFFIIIENYSRKYR